MSSSADPKLQQYDYIISLGCNCRATESLRRFFNFGTAFPFDWWVSPLSSIADYIESGFDSDTLYDPANLEAILNNNGAIETIKSKVFGMLLHHEFRRDEEHLITPAWQTGILAAKSRHDFLVQQISVGCCALTRELHSFVISIVAMTAVI